MELCSQTAIALVLVYGEHVNPLATKRPFPLEIARNQFKSVFNASESSENDRNGYFEARNQMS
jgi:hypothetical protein